MRYALMLTILALGSFNVALAEEQSTTRPRLADIMQSYARSAVISPANALSAEGYTVLSIQVVDSPSATIAPVSGEQAYDDKYLIDPSTLLPR